MKQVKMDEGRFLSELLEGKKTAALSGHVHPDGDCLGSCLGLYLYLKENYPHISADVYLQDIPEKFRIIEGCDDIKSTIDKDRRYDIFFSLDCGEKSRLGFSQALLENAETTVCIDHHIVSKTFADVNYIFPEKSSVCELIYELLDKEKISRPIAEALFLGIAHDTGVFQYPCTSPETMEAAADLMRKGINASDIIEKTYYERTYTQNRLLGKMLYKSRLLLDGKFVVSLLEKEDLEQFKATANDINGIVRQLRQTKGTAAALLIYAGEEEDRIQKQGNVYKLSLRSGSEVNVNAIAKALGGGGHMRAAGATVAGDAEEIIDRVCRMIKEQLKV